MKNFFPLILMIFSVLFIGCKSHIVAPQTYGDIDDPYHTRCRLVLKEDNTYKLIYYSIVEKTTGKWDIKNDTLVLNSEYISYLDNDKDSTVFKEKRIFLIKRKKLFHPENKNFYLKRIK